MDRTLITKPLRHWERLVWARRAYHLNKSITKKSFSKWLLVLATVLVGPFFAVGLVFPRFGFQSQVQVAAPIEEVYRVFAQSKQFGHQKLKARSIGEKGGSSIADGEDTSQVEVNRSRTLIEWQVKQSLLSQIETERMSLLTSVAFLQARNGTVVLVSNTCNCSQNPYNRSDSENIYKIDMPKQPIDFMFSPYRRQLLARLLLHPDEKFHVRELGRMTGISAGSLHRELRAMSESGLLLREKRGNQVLYQADSRCPIYPELSAIFRKTMGMASILSAALSGLAYKVHVAFIFGSMASGLQNASSDVDVCVVGDVSLLGLVTALSSAQEALGREINPVAMAVQKFKEQAANEDRFVTRLLSEPKIFLKGGEDELAKLVENRTA